MEFFKEIKKSDMGISELKKLLTINNLPVLCKSINSVILDEQKKGLFIVSGESLKLTVRS